MVTIKQIVKGAISHLFLLIVNFAVLLGIIWSIHPFLDSGNPLPLLNAIVLGYMIVHTSLLLSIQLGIQILEIIKIKSPTILVIYYFKFSDQETIPLPLLDPTKNRLAVIILLLVISGGILLYPIFAIYGFLIIGVRLPIIAIAPPIIIDYFVIFLNYVPPLLLIAFVIIILSIVMIEFKHV
ncbi:hypothetical protein EU527_01055 [Candidatus Thorarchaeota archaeon]|nr:MAG: hypothetical protein EU527_01055 [Candidatus Thorarchaeota archaeon]